MATDGIRMNLIILIGVNSILMLNSYKRRKAAPAAFELNVCFSLVQCILSISAL
jgi:hypothetical protein